MRWGFIDDVILLMNSATLQRCWCLYITWNRRMKYYYVLVSDKRRPISLAEEERNDHAARNPQPIFHTRSFFLYIFFRQQSVDFFFSSTTVVGLCFKTER